MHEERYAYFHYIISFSHYSSCCAFPWFQDFNQPCIRALALAGWKTTKQPTGSTMQIGFPWFMDHTQAGPSWGTFGRYVSRSNSMLHGRWSFFVAGRRKAWVASIAAIVLSILGRYVFVALKWESGIYSATITHLDGLAIGSLAAFLYKTAYREKLLKNAISLLLLGGTACLVTAHYSRINLTAAVSFASCALVLSSLRAVSRSERFFSNRALVQCGKYSYSMYVFHLPITWLSCRAWRSSIGDSMNWQILYTPTMIGVSYGIARLTWWTAEKRLLALKRHFEVRMC
jgi:peptidoglycan/LPS O-acetylase OafA/YrhL